MKNALCPYITSVCMQFGQILTGSILIEIVFSWNGMGSLIYSSVSMKDYPMLQTCFLFIGRGVLSISNAMLTEASLSFWGLGVIGQKSWGGILYYAFFRNGVINGYYWWYLPPIVCISISVLWFMLLGYYNNETPACLKAHKLKGEYTHAANP